MTFTPVILRSDVVRQLGALGVQPGGILLVHTAFSQVGQVEGGPSMSRVQ